jgi:DNA-binding transcriptional LysR family regulator
MHLDPHSTGDWLIFVKVVERGSITAGADALDMPKTSVSRRVRTLEERLGVLLLQRTTRRLELTEAGRAFYTHCQPLVIQLQEAEAAARELQSSPRGTLRITASLGLMPELIGPLLPAFQQQHPEVIIDVALNHQVESLPSPAFDLALRLGPLPDSGLVARRLARLSNHVYASPAYVSQWGTPHTPEDLAAHRALVSRLAQNALADVAAPWVWSLQREDSPLQRYPIRPVMVADDLEALKPALLAGQGLMLITDARVQALVEQGRLVQVLPGWRGRCPELHAVFPHGLIQPAKVRAFVDFLVERLAASRINAHADAERNDARV